MCGRDAAFFTWAEIHAFSQPLTIETPADEPLPQYNRAPTQSAWTLVAGDGTDLRAYPMRWGLVPRWAKDAKIGYSTINARVDTACTKPSFRDAWKHRRCLVPASGYYEWPVLADGKTKQPYFIRDADAPVLMFAGLWERWQGPDGPLDTYSIVTQDAAGDVATIHDRMPLALPQSMLRDWVYGDADTAAAIAQAAPVPSLVFHPVGRDVGNVRNQGPTLIEALAEAPRGLL